jgi:bifunctional non-homologous end joining protein LigD
MSGRDLLDGLPADAKARLRKRAQPKWVAPMLATLTDEVFSRQGWLFEPKWDGERCLAFRRGRDLDLFSRNRIRLNAKYPEVVEAIHRQETASFIANGEIVTFEGAITSFAKLQARMQVRHPSADLIRKIPVWFYLFDLLYLDRYDIRQVPLRYRKQVLRNAFGFQGSLRLTEHRETEENTRRSGEVAANASLSFKNTLPLGDDVESKSIGSDHPGESQRRPK